MLTILAAAPHTNFTTYAEVKEYLRLDYDDDVTIIQRMIQRASAAILRAVHRPFARERYSEFLPGHGDTSLMLSRTPLLIIEQVLYQDAAITDYRVLNPLSGILYREFGWIATREWGVDYQMLVPHQLPNDVRLLYQVDYVAGYLMPDDNLSNSATLSTSSVDNSYNDSTGTIPLLVAGDMVEVAGFSTAGNNGRSTVVSRTTTKLVVSGRTLVTEAAGGQRGILVRTLPEDLEEACLEIVRGWYLERVWDLAGPRIIDTPGGTRVINRPAGTLPDAARALLEPWVRLF